MDRSAISFQTGPVDVHPSVRECLGAPFVSHRSAEFLDALDEVENHLRRLTGASRAAIFAGSGTLANDMVARQLIGFGAIIANGEFGERLADHAKRANRSFAVCRSIESVCRVNAEWVWSVHCETSTGQMFDLSELKALGKPLYLDCVSSLGAVDIDLSGVSLASFGSGKALASVAGLAGVLIGDGGARSGAERSLDVSRYMLNPVPATIPSGPVMALRQALGFIDPHRFRDIRKAGEIVHAMLSGLGIQTVCDDAPHVFTIKVPRSVVASELAERLAGHGVLVSAGSDYLVRHNRFQIALMGFAPLAGLDTLLAALKAEWPC